MAVITIPKKFTNGKELIVVPKKDWEKLKKIAGMRVFRGELEKGLKEALAEISRGETKGPFKNTKDLFRDLEKK